MKSLFQHIAELTAAGYRVEIRRELITIQEDRNGTDVEGINCNIVDPRYWTKEEGLRVIIETAREALGA